MVQEAAVLRDTRLVLKDIVAPVWAATGGSSWSASRPRLDRAARPERLEPALLENCNLKRGIAGEGRTAREKVNSGGLRIMRAKCAFPEIAVDLMGFKAEDKMNNCFTN